MRRGRSQDRWDDPVFAIRATENDGEITVFYAIKVVRLHWAGTSSNCDDSGNSGTSGNSGNSVSSGSVSNNSESNITL